MRRQIRRGETIQAGNSKAGRLYVKGGFKRWAFAVSRGNHLNSATHVRSYVTDDNGKPVICNECGQTKVQVKPYPSSAVEIEC